MKQKVHFPTKEQIVENNKFEKELENTPFVPILPFEGKLELVLEAFRQHKPIARASKSKEYLFIYQQIPAKIDLSIVPKMTSVPSGVKEIMEQLQKGFNYKNQAVKVDEDGNTTYWIPTIEDLLAEDWYIVEI